MPKKKSDKKIECFSASFNDILICQKPAERPYVEVFVEEPENVTRQNLGILAGILEITDDSEDSSYIVNYLVSVLKKEYYARPKRGAVESFEAALKKANLALAKLAEHETVGWIGRTNAILLVIDKNNLHLSTSGSAKALLLRGKTLTDLSDGGESADPNPIKTFTDIVSGRLEENDKLIAATSAMFDLFSFEEIKKSALKFSSEEFLRFLKTALVNELDRAASLIIEIRKEEKVISKKQVEKKESFNAFSQTAFAKKETVRKNTSAKKQPRKPPAPAENFYAGQQIEKPSKDSSERQAIVREIKEELAKDKTDFVDEKTGHIYIKEDRHQTEENSSFLEILGIWQEKLSDFSLLTLDFCKSLGHKLKNIQWPKIPARKKEIPTEKESFAPTARTSAPDESIEKHIPVEEVASETELEEMENRLIFYWKEYYPRAASFFRKIYEKSVRSFQGALFITLRSGRRGWITAKEFWLERRARKEARQLNEKKTGSVQADEAAETTNSPEEETGSNERKDWMEKYEEKLANNSSYESAYPAPETKIGASHDFKKFLPRLARLKDILSRLDYSQRIYVALAIVFLFVVPYFLARIGKKTPPESAPVEQVKTAEVLPLAQDKNVIRPDKTDAVYSGKNISNVIDLGGAFYAVSGNGMVDIAGGGAVYPWPDNFSPRLSTGMHDLNMVFILGQNNRLIAWSPANKKFQDNSITLPDNTDITAIKTYLTYLYVLDGTSGQIWRYPRTDGGFGDQSAWLKNPDESTGATTMAVSDNIYLSDGKNISKFLQGQKQDFSLEGTATPIEIEALYAKRDYQNLYILDKVNGRVIKADLNGRIVAQYYNAEIKNATSFAVDEEKNLVYIASPTNVEKFEMK